MITIAIGDIHGCLDELEKLVEKLSAYKNRSDVRWVFLGDYVDRGPDVRGVVNFLLEHQMENNCVFLKGNHEDMMLTPHDYMSWIRNGGGDTLKSYPNGELDKTHLEFYRHLVLSYETENYFFCHAGIAPWTDLDKQLPEDLLWIRQTFLSSTKDHGKIIVHGHTPQSLEEPLFYSNRINLDTGCVFGGRLTALIIEDGKDPTYEQVQSNFKWGTGHLVKKDYNLAEKM